MRVLVALSGGVDSSVAASLLVEAGHQLVGLTMKNYCYGDVGPSGAPERSCCSLDAIDDARGVCDRVGIRHLVADTEELFGREVYDNFLDEYRAGRTAIARVLAVGLFLLVPLIVLLRRRRRRAGDRSE